MKAVVNIGPNLVPFVFRAVISCLFGAILCWVLRVTFPVLDSGAVAMLIVLVPLCLLMVIPAIRGFFNWPYRVRLSTSDLTTVTLVGGRSSTDATSIRAMQKTRYWHGGRDMFNGLILHLAHGGRIVLSEGNLESIDALHTELLKLGIPEPAPR